MAIEVKHAREFRREHRESLEAFGAATRATRVLVYRGDRELEAEGTRVLPVETFLRRLRSGDIIG